ncbi:hypothetical protein BGX34_008036, partial [Mortierella sp. NVP85]
PYERWLEEDEIFLTQFTKPTRLREAITAYNGLRKSQRKKERTEKSIAIKLYKLENGGNGILPGFDSDTVHEAVLNSLDQVDSELQLIGKRQRLDELQDEIRVLKRELWKSRQNTLEIRREEDLDHAMRMEKIQDLEERMFTEFEMDQ